MRIAVLIAVAFAGSLAFCAAQAQPAPPPAFVRVAGAVAALGDETVAIHGVDGKDVSVALAPGWVLVAAHPVDRSAIKPGSFVATANLPQGDGVGQSIEIRLFEPGSHLGEGSRPMAQPGQVMTNATVTKVETTAAGLELDVAYPGGSRHLIVPPQLQVIASVPQDPSTLTVGTNVTILATRAADGGLKTSRIQLAPPKP